MNIKNLLNKIYNKLLKNENCYYIILVIAVFLLITYQYSQTTKLNATQTLSQAPIDVKLEEPILIKANGDHNTYDNLEVIIPASKEIEVEEVVEVEEEVVEQEETWYLEKFEGNVTMYTAGYESTGKTPDHPDYGLTASGKMVERGVTAACPPELPFNTVIYIEGIGERICEDRGAAIVSGHIDIYVKSLDKAINFGRQYLTVYIIEYGS